MYQYLRNLTAEQQVSALFISVFFGGSLIIETIFSLDGLGQLGYKSAVERDYPVIFGTLMDGQRFGAVLIGIAVLQTMAIFTALRVGKTA